MKEGSPQQEKFNFNSSLISEKNSFADYSDEEKTRFDSLILKARINREGLPPWLQRYENFKNSQINKPKN